MASFGIIFFFAATGLTLNHADWFANQQHTVQSRGTVDRNAFSKKIDKLDVVEHLRNAHGLRGAVKDFRVEDSDLSVSFKGPGYSADVLIERATGSSRTNRNADGPTLQFSMTFIKDEIRVKAGLGSIDASAVLTALVSLTGLLLIFFL